MLRSTPCGRGGLFLGNSPLATRSVQSAKYLIGEPASWPARMLTMSATDCPACVRFTQASEWLANSPRPGGDVAVDNCPIWCQPKQPLFFIRLSQSVCLTLSGMSTSFLPNWLGSGIFSIEYQ